MFLEKLKLLKLKDSLKKPLKVFIVILGLGMLVLVAFYTIAIPTAVVSSSGILFQPGQQLLSEKITFLLREPQIGDRVVFLWKESKEGNANTRVGIITNTTVSAEGELEYGIRTDPGQFPDWVSRNQIKSQIYFPFLSSSETKKLLNKIIYIPTTNYTQLKGWSEYRANCPGLDKIEFYIPEGWRVGGGSGNQAYWGAEEAKDSCEIFFSYPNVQDGMQEYKPGVYGIIGIQSWHKYEAAGIPNLREEVTRLSKEVTSTQEINGRQFIIGRRPDNGVIMKIWGTETESWAYKVTLYVLRENYEGTLSSEEIRYIEETGEEFVKRIKFPANYSKQITWLQYPANCPGMNKIKFYVPEGWKLGEGSGYPLFSGPGAENSCYIHFGYPNPPGSPQDAWAPGVYGIIGIASWLGPSGLDGLREQYHLTQTRETNGRTFAYGESSYSENTQVKRWATIIGKNWSYIISLQIDEWNYGENLAPEVISYLQQTGEEFVRRIEFTSP